MKRLCVILPVLGIPDVIGNTVLSKPPASGGETGLKFLVKPPAGEGGLKETLTEILLLGSWL